MDHFREHPRCWSVAVASGTRGIAQLPVALTDPSAATVAPTGDRSKLFRPGQRDDRARTNQTSSASGCPPHTRVPKDAVDACLLPPAGGRVFSKARHLSDVDRDWGWPARRQAAGPDSNGSRPVGCGGRRRQLKLSRWRSERVLASTGSLMTPFAMQSTTQSLRSHGPTNPISRCSSDPTLELLFSKSACSKPTIRTT